MIDISYILGMIKGKRIAGGSKIDIEGNLSVTEDEDGYIVIEEDNDGE